MLRVKDNARCRTHRNGKPRKKAPRSARRRKSGEAKGRPSHIGRGGLRDDLLQHSIRDTRNTQIRRSESKHLSVSKWKSLKTGFPTPFLRSLMLRTCEWTSSAGTMKAPVPSLSGKRTLSFAAKISHCNTSHETPGTHRSGATSSKQLSTSKRGKFEYRFSNAVFSILNAENLSGRGALGR